MTALVVAALVLVAFMVGGFVVAQCKHDNSIVDVMYGLGYVLSAWVVAAAAGVENARGWVLLALITAWGLRLAFHIGRRNWGRGEDYRYTRMRAGWGRRQGLNALVRVFLLQGAIILVINAGVLYALGTPGPGLGALDGAGIVLWMLGFYFEAVGDHQLWVFRQDPGNRGTVMRTGLWRYSRHPNYFGEVVQWWGIYLIVAAAPGGAWFVFSPVLITLLIGFVSGIPLLERRYAASPAYDEYRRTTSIFLPMPPRRPEE
jgi:steroid 5-alpha reductase family enzyme